MGQKDFFSHLFVQPKHKTFFVFFYHSVKQLYRLYSNLKQTLRKDCNLVCTVHLLLFLQPSSSFFCLPLAFLLHSVSPSSLCVLAGCQVLRIWGMQDCNVLIKFALFPKWPEWVRETERVVLISPHTHTYAHAHLQSTHMHMSTWSCCYCT